MAHPPGYLFHLECKIRQEQSDYDFEWNFARELLQRYLELRQQYKALLPRLKMADHEMIEGPEIAAMVDHAAIALPSIKKAILLVKEQLDGYRTLEDTLVPITNRRFSAEAIKAHHKTYGLTDVELKRLRAEYHLKRQETARRREESQEK